MGVRAINHVIDDLNQNRAEVITMEGKNKHKKPRTMSLDYKGIFILM